MMQNNTVEDEEKELPEDLYQEIERRIANIFGKVSDTNEKKGSTTTNPVSQLMEMERQLDNHMRDITILERIDDNRLHKQERDIREERRGNERKEKLEQDQLALAKKNLEKQEEKKKRANIVRTGRTEMQRSEKPAPRRKVEKKIQYTEEQLDRMHYLGF